MEFAIEYPGIVISKVLNLPVFEDLRPLLPGIVFQSIYRLYFEKETIRLLEAVMHQCIPCQVNSISDIKCLMTHNFNCHFRMYHYTSKHMQGNDIRPTFIKLDLCDLELDIFKVAVDSGQRFKLRKWVRILKCDKHLLAQLVGSPQASLSFGCPFTCIDSCNLSFCRFFVGAFKSGLMATES